MAEDHGAPKGKKLLRVYFRDRRKRKVAKKRAAQRVRSWSVQNEIIRVRCQKAICAA